MEHFLAHTATNLVLIVHLRVVEPLSLQTILGVELLDRRFVIGKGLITTDDHHADADEGRGLPTGYSKNRPISARCVMSGFPPLSLPNLIC